MLSETLPKMTEDKKLQDFNNNVNTLLHAESSVKRLIGVMSLYGRLYYDWTLASDIIEWRGPVQLLFGSKSNITTGDTFLKKLTLEDFKLRIAELSHCFKTRKSFEIQYHLHLGEGYYCVVEENAELLFTRDGRAAKILGSIKIRPQALSMKPKPHEVMDKDTNVLNDNELEKALTSSILKSQRDNVYGAYISLSIDKLTNLIAFAGESGVKKVIKFIVDTLRANIREEDKIGRLAGNAFGIVLWNCDRWGIVLASERLLGKVQEAQLQIGETLLQLTISSGGAVFPCETLSASEIMHEADMALLDAQNTKGISRYWAPSIIKGGAQKPPEKKNAKKGKRRMIDPDS